MINIKKILLTAMVTVTSITLWGCGKSVSADATTITIEKDGKISSVIVEAFDKEYYLEEELKSSIESDIADYNRANGADTIVLNGLTVKDGLASPSITYQNAKAYADFNNKKFFYGTVAEAYEKEYLLDITLKNVADESQTIDKNGILANGNMHILIAEEPVHIRTLNNISYVSDNITMVNKKEAAIAADSNQLAYLLFK